MRRITIFNNTLRVMAALLLVGVLLFQNVAQNEKVAAWTDEADNVVTYLVKERNVSTKEAQKRIGWQKKAGALDQKLQKVLPETDFGGTWINNSNDRVTVGLVDKSDMDNSSKQKVINEARAFGISDGIDTVPVKYSYAELGRIAESISKMNAKYLKDSHWPIQVGPKIDLNKVQVDIPADDKNLTDAHRFVLSEIEKKYRDQVFFETYDEMPEEQAECNWWFCNSPLRGGVGIKGNYSNFSNLDCTAGFIVRGNESGKLYVLTAGHCGQGGYGWGTETYNYTTKLIGSITMTMYDDPTYTIPYTYPVDAMIIDIKEDVYNWQVMGKILKRSGDSNTAMNGVAPPAHSEEYDIQTYTSSVVNERICISGAVTGGFPTEPNGGSCGKVQQTNVYWDGEGTAPTTQVHRAGYCSRGGDSGAPIFASQNDAKGIHRGAKHPNDPCDNYKYYTPMSVIINRFNSVGSPISVY